MRGHDTVPAAINSRIGVRGVKEKAPLVRGLIIAEKEGLRGPSLGRVLRTRCARADLRPADRSNRGLSSKSPSPPNEKAPLARGLIIAEKEGSTRAILALAAARRRRCAPASDWAVLAQSSNPGRSSKSPSPPNEETPQVRGFLIAEKEG